MPRPASPGEMLQTIRRNIHTETHKTFEQWLVVARKAGIKKHKELTNWLKQEKGLRHNQAIWIAWEVIEPGRASQYENPGQLLDALYSDKKAHLRPIYDAIIKACHKMDSDIKVVVCKTYSSLRTKAQFAIIIPRTQSAIDIELALPPKTKSTNLLEAYSGHNEKFNFRIRVPCIAEVNASVLSAINAANNFITTQ